MTDSNRNPTEGLIIATRHEHELCRLERLPKYECSGCKEAGENVGYQCKLKDSSSCRNFTLHHDCATVRDEFQHPHHGLFKFRSKTHLRHTCDACLDVLRGFVFESERPRLRLHPLCMTLPLTLQFSGHADHKLVMDDSTVDEYTCNACNNQASGGWRYLCKGVKCRVRVDLSCAKIDHHGISVSRIAPKPGGRWLTSKRGKRFGKALLALTLDLGVAVGVIVEEMNKTGGDQCEGEG